MTTEMTERHPLVIINPKSASGKTGRRWPSVAPLLLSRLPNAECVFTTRAGEGTDLARRALQEGPRLIVAAGGDGTVNEVVNGFFDERGTPLQTQARLGVLPLGTGSDLCRSLGIPRDPALAVELLTEPSRAVDCGWAETDEMSHAFLNIASLGISSEVARHFEEHGKSGVISYVSGLFSAARRYEERRLTLRFDVAARSAAEPEWVERTLTSAFVCALANGQFFGGGMHIAPDAQLNDGLLQCVMVRGLNTLEILRYLPSLFRGKHLKHEPFSALEARGVELIVNRDTYLELDGEPVLCVKPERPARVKLIPHALKVHTAQHGAALQVS